MVTTVSSHMDPRPGFNNRRGLLVITCLLDMRTSVPVIMGLFGRVHLVSYYAEDTGGLRLFHKQCERLTTPVRQERKCEKTTEKTCSEPNWAHVPWCEHPPCTHTHPLILSTVCLVKNTWGGFIEVCFMSWSEIFGRFTALYASVFDADMFSCSGGTSQKLSIIKDLL